jgi:hypothetical protein
MARKYRARRTNLRAIAEGAEDAEDGGHSNKVGVSAQAPTIGLPTTVNCHP